MNMPHTNSASLYYCKKKRFSWLIKATKRSTAKEVIRRIAYPKHQQKGRTNNSKFPPTSYPIATTKSHKKEPVVMSTMPSSPLSHPSMDCILPGVAGAVHGLASISC
jgi:hypothetical protein